MQIFYWLFVIAPILVGLIFVLWFTNRNTKDDTENIEILKNVDKALLEGKITKEDALEIKKSILGD